MNIIDILILVILIYAAYSGFREGLIVQIASLAGVGLSLWLGAKYSSQAAEMLQLSGDYSLLLGFLIGTIVIMILITIVGRLMHNLVKFVGLGFIDKPLGVVLSIVKYLLMLALIFTSINLINTKHQMFEPKELNRSKLYMPIANISNHFTPAWNWINEQITNDENHDGEF